MTIKGLLLHLCCEIECQCLNNLKLEYNSVFCNPRWI
jgi:hypothetical protein